MASRNWHTRYEMPFTTQAEGLYHSISLRYSAWPVKPSAWLWLLQYLKKFKRWRRTKRTHQKYIVRFWKLDATSFARGYHARQPAHDDVHILISERCMIDGSGESEEAKRGDLKEVKAQYCAHMSWFWLRGDRTLDWKIWYFKQYMLINRTAERNKVDPVDETSGVEIGFVIIRATYTSALFHTLDAGDKEYLTAKDVCIMQNTTDSLFYESVLGNGRSLGLFHTPRASKPLMEERV